MIVRFYALRALGRVGHGAIAPDARYCAILWRGEHRIERRHLPAAAWPKVESEVHAAASSVDVDSDVRRAFAPNDASADILALALVDITAAPMRIAAAIDAQLRDQGK